MLGGVANAAIMPTVRSVEEFKWITPTALTSIGVKY